MMISKYKLLNGVNYFLDNFKIRISSINFELFVLKNNDIIIIKYIIHINFILNI